MTLDDRLRWRARGEEILVPKQFDAHIKNILESLPVRKIRRNPALRVILVAAAVCALLGATAWAYVTGAFPFLTDREEYRFLGQTELYEKYAKPVDLTQTAANGDVLTIESMVMDGNLCIVFYTVRTKEPMNPKSFWDADMTGEPDLWKGTAVSPHFSITARGVDITGASIMTGQQYLMNERTLCGMACITLNRPLERGESFYLRAISSFAEHLQNPTGETAQEKWLFSLTADPLETKLIWSEQQTVVLDGNDNRHDIKYVSFSRSELSTILRVGELVPEAYRGSALGEWPELEFVVRDGKTGAYIPYSYVSGGGGDLRCITYELYGVPDDTELLELIPVRRGEESAGKTAMLSDLPVRSDNAAGGYSVSSVEIRKDKIIVAQHPMGATTAASSGIGFLDADGKRLFDGEDAPGSHVYVDVFIDGSDGSVVTTYSLENVPQSYLDRIAQIRFYDVSFTLLEDQMITVSLK